MPLVLVCVVCAGVVQTSYANGSATEYIRSTLVSLYAFHCTSSIVMICAVTWPILLFTQIWRCGCEAVVGHAWTSLAVCMCIVLTSCSRACGIGFQSKGSYMVEKVFHVKSKRSLTSMTSRRPAL